ncbi:MAG: NAD(P)/FAD-dependent oxidoreductase, partial [Patescibacteria group bacterium]
AVSADGGGPPAEGDFTTMRSKKTGNLFITGDLLNISRPSGGYSLQLCWSSGFVAGTHAVIK